MYSISEKIIHHRASLNGIGNMTQYPRLIGTATNNQIIIPKRTPSARPLPSRPLMKM